MPGDEAAERERVGHAVTCIGAGLREEAEQGARRRIVVVDSGDEQQSTSPGEGAHEQAQLVVQHSAAPALRVGLIQRMATSGRRDRVGETPGVEHPAAQAHIGPDAVLDTGDDDGVELGAESRGGCQQRHRSRALRG